MPEPKIYFDRDAAVEYVMRWHEDEPRNSADDLLDDEGICACCGVDYTGLDRDTLEPEHYTPLAAKPWTPAHRGAQQDGPAGRVDFDDDTGTTAVTIRVENNGSGYVVHIDQHDEAPLIVSHQTG